MVRDETHRFSSPFPPPPPQQTHLHSGSMTCPHRRQTQRLPSERFGSVSAIKQASADLMNVLGEEGDALRGAQMLSCGAESRS
jgi:hypothetical protein